MKETSILLTHQTFPAAHLIFQFNGRKLRLDFLIAFQFSLETFHLLFEQPIVFFHFPVVKKRNNERAKQLNSPS